MTELLAAMLGIATFQLTTTRTRADMLCLEVVSGPLSCRVERTWLPPSRLSLSCFALASTAVLTTLVSPTVECNATDPHALRSLLGTLMTNRGERVAPTSACDGDCLHARPALALMTRLFALMTAF